MELRLICLGKIRESWLRDGIAEYIKRLRRDCHVQVIELADRPDTLPGAVALAQEAEQILACVRPADWVVALDLAGHTVTSVELARLLPRWLERGKASVTFIIGSSRGLGETVLRRADYRLCLSALTFTHQFTRLILLEQCYRAFRIQAGEPYHK